MADDVRVSDAERRQVADRLAQAQAQGRLALHEFDERVRAAYGAVLRSDLAPLTADLPAPDADDPSARSEALDRPAARDGSRDRRPGLRAAVGVWATVSAVNLAIWAVVALLAPGPVHPWWIWVAGPWGAVLALHALAGRHLPTSGVGPRGFPFAPPMPCVLRPRR